MKKVYLIPATAEQTLISDYAMVNVGQSAYNGEANAPQRNGMSLKEL